MTNDANVKEINARYRAYCDACQSGQLEKVPAFWGFPVLFTVDAGKPETLHQVLSTPDELIKLYSTEFGSSTGVDTTVIDSSEVVFYGDQLATIRTALRHLAGSKLHDTQHAIYGCRKLMVSGSSFPTSVSRLPSEVDNSESRGHTRSSGVFNVHTIWLTPDSVASAASVGTISSRRASRRASGHQRRCRLRWFVHRSRRCARPAALRPIRTARRQSRSWCWRCRGCRRSNGARGGW